MKAEITKLIEKYAREKGKKYNEGATMDINIVVYYGMFNNIQ